MKSMLTIIIINTSARTWSNYTKNYTRCIFNFWTVPVQAVFCISVWLGGWGPSQSTPLCKAPPHLSVQTSPSPSLQQFPLHPRFRPSGCGRHRRGEAQNCRRPTRKSWWGGSNVTTQKRQTNGVRGQGLMLEAHLHHSNQPLHMQPNLFKWSRQNSLLRLCRVSVLNLLLHL